MNYQELHNLKQQNRRLRLQLVEQKNQYEKLIQNLRREILRPKIDIREHKHQWSDVMRCVCQVFNLTPDDIYSPIRTQQIIYARHTFNHICRTRLNMSLEAIGRIINRDHSTIIHSVRQTNDLIEYDKQFDKTYKQTTRLLDSYSNEEFVVIDSHTQRRERCVENEEAI